MGIRAKLNRVKRLARAMPPTEPHLWVACTDADGLVLDDGTEACQRWVGRHYAELPGPVSVVSGIDLRVVVGDAPGLEWRSGPES